MGVAVYDTTTGEVVRHAFPTEHGLWPEALVWADARRLAIKYQQYLGGVGDSEMDQSSGDHPSELLVWDPVASTKPSGLGSWTRKFNGVEHSNGLGQLLLEASDYAVMDVDHPVDAIDFKIDDLSYGNVTAIDRTGAQVAWPRGDRNPNTMVFGPIIDGEVVKYRKVPDSTRTDRVWAWLDVDHVAAVLSVESDLDSRLDLASVDIHSGASRTLIRFPDISLGGTGLATDLLTNPTVDRPAPPDPPDPRLVATATGILVLAGVAMLVAWRRRVRP